ncbi:MAG TPA: proline iminopeptidase-family hydrolase [Gemmatimonadales bacterium]
MTRSRAGLGLCLLAACAGPSPATEGFVTVPGGRIWYARMGNGPGTPLIVIHGGPGSTSYGLKPWAALGDDRPVYRYDQLGSGKSDHPTDTTLFTVDRSVRELQALRDSLGLAEVHLYGRSWGAMLVEAYMGTSPAGVRSVILSSPLVTTAQWEQDADSLLRALPDSVQQVIARHEADNTTGAPAYQAAAAEYYRLYLTRQPRRSPADADSAARGFGALVYNYMWGPSEFTATGTLKHFDATEWLRSLRVPALFLAGEFDEATPASTEKFSRLVPGSEFAIIPNSGHSTENDNPEALIATVRAFLRRVDAGERVRASAP